MSQILTSIVPLFAFMLIPVWIPVIAAVGGAVLDPIRPKSVTAAGAAVEAAKERSLAARQRFSPTRRTPATTALVHDEVAEEPIAA